MCGLHIVVHADELEELINYYQVMKLTPVTPLKSKFCPDPETPIQLGS